jgi:peptide/nickel transport system substrate-binding protein
MAADRRSTPRLAAVRVSRRRLLAVGAVSASAAALAAACGGSKRTADATPTRTPRRGGTLRTGTTLPIAYGLDPQIETGTGLAIFPRVYGYLHHVDPDGDTLVRDHVREIEQPDATTYIFHLRTDVRFPDIAPVNGRAVTSEDVALSIARYRDNPLVATKTWHTTMLDRVETPDAATVRVTTRIPYVWSLAELGGISGGAIIPKEQLATDLSAGGAGSGPFRVEHASREDGARIVRNDSYYGAPLPYLDAMEWVLFADDDAKEAALRSHAIDAAAAHDRFEARALADASKDLLTDAERGLAWLSIGLRVDQPPFADERVRRAIDIGLDRAAMIRDIAFNDGEELGPVNPHMAGGYWSLPPAEVTAAHESARPLDERRADARALIEAAGAATAPILLQVANLPQLLDVATVVRDQLREIGLTIELEAIDQLTWFLGFRRGHFAATLISHEPYETPDLPTRLYHSRGLDGTESPFGFGDATIDLLLERSWGEADRAVRRDTLLEAQRKMLEARPLLTLFTNTSYQAAWRYVQGRQPGVTGAMAQYNYGQWLDATPAGRPD